MTPLDVIFHFMNDNVPTTAALIVMITVLIMIGIEVKNCAMVFLFTIPLTVMTVVALFHIPTGAIS